MIYTDRSRIVIRNECPRLGYWTYEADGKGYVPQATPMPLINGIIIHNAFAKLLLGEQVHRAVQEALAEYAAAVLSDGIPWTEEKQFTIDEQRYLLAGIILAFAKQHLPRLLEEFDVAMFPGTLTPWVEKEFTTEITPGVSAMLRMDVVLVRKTTGDLVILDFKSLSYLSNDWMEKWKHNAQTYLYVEAVKRKSGREVEGIMYLGMIKGTRRMETNLSVPWSGKKVQSSPYCYGYQGPHGEIQTEYTPRKGWKKVRACDVTSDPFEWFEDVILPAHYDTGLLDKLFCVVLPYVPPQWEIERWLRQTGWQEYLLSEYKQEVKDAFTRGDLGEGRRLIELYYPTNEERCFKYGADNKCPYISLCFTQDPNPLEQGFVVRTPHHDTETKEAA